MHIYAIGLHVSEKQGSTVLYYRQYHLGSSRLVTDSSENRAWTRNYGPYSPLSGGSTAERWLYAGKSLDSSTGLYYFGARYYDPSIGRFIAEDPLSGGILDPQSLNRYVYCRNNPHKYTDPDGHGIIPFLLLITGVGAALGGWAYWSKHPGD